MKRGGASLARDESFLFKQMTTPFKGCEVPTLPRSPTLEEVGSPLDWVSLASPVSSTSLLTLVLGGWGSEFTFTMRCGSTGTIV